MATSRPNRTTQRIFGPNESALRVQDNSPTISIGQLARSAASFVRQPPNPSFTSRWRVTRDAEPSPSTPSSDRPPIPSALTKAAEADATPLPILSMIVLSITMLGEFLSANVSAPFLLFMVEGFGEFTDEADVGFWTGILASCFFLTQFLTSLLWATVADKHGQRVVLIISLLGTAITCFLFGTSTSMNQAIVTRLLQGIFAGAIGVARGCVVVITDQSNEGRAYSILGFCWGLGGVAGAIIGAMFESPAEKWPETFINMPFFEMYPYILPCLIASSITIVGAFLALFLGPDGGRRGGAIRLADKERSNRGPSSGTEDIIALPGVGHPRSSLLGSLVPKKLSVYFTREGYGARDSAEFATEQYPPVPMLSTRTTSLGTSGGNGSAYGYGGSYRNRLASTNAYGTRISNLDVSIRQRRGSHLADSTRSPTVGYSGELNFTQRLLMANENAVTNISDLWVSAAMNVDNEGFLESGLDSESNNSDLDFAVGENRSETEADRTMSITSRVGLQVHPGAPSYRMPANPRQSAPPVSPGRSAHHSRRSLNQQFPSTSGSVGDESPGSRRHSSTAIPTIFSHSGVRTPPAILEAQRLLNRREDGELLELVTESQHDHPLEVTEGTPSLYSLLPIVIIVHYGLLALHSTTHDQVFYLYLVSKYKSGGLNLNAGHFGQLIALMCFCQIVYQFYLYPNIGPPRGRFSHLAMFRLGSLLFVPAYLSVILYRAFASPEGDGDFILMTALAISTALRYCGATFCYTSISVLLNYMSPPHVVGFANGIAQSIVSFSRFLGPIVGGTLWSMSVEHDPKGYPIGFLVCACACSFALIHSFFIR